MLWRLNITWAVRCPCKYINGNTISLSELVPFVNIILQIWSCPQFQDHLLPFINLVGELFIYWGSFIMLTQIQCLQLNNSESILISTMYWITHTHQCIHRRGCQILWSNLWHTNHPIWFAQVLSCASWCQQCTRFFSNRHIWLWWWTGNLVYLPAKSTLRLWRKIVRGK